ERFLEQVGAELGIGVQLLQPPVLVLQFLHPADHGHLHAAELAAPLIERRRADAVLSAQLRHGRTGLGLLEHGDDLAVGEARLLHGNLLGESYEKIPLLASTNLWGDYHGSEAFIAEHALGRDAGADPG